MRVIRETHLTRRRVIALAALGLVGGAPGSARADGPQGQLTWGVHVSRAPIWFDPADTSGIITPFMVLYALHDAMVKPMPGQALAPSLAESWTASEDGLSYDFTLRKDILFHNGEQITAEDVKFSYERYRGASHDMMQERAGGIYRHHGSEEPSLPAQGAMARLPDVLRQRHRGGLDRAEEIRRESRRRRVQKGTDRRWALQIRVVQSGHRAGARSLRRILAQAGERAACGDQSHSRRVDKAGGAEDRRGRHRVLDQRRARRRPAAHAGAHPQGGGGADPVVGVLPGAMGPEIAVARRAAAAGRRPRDRSQGHQ